jgi:F0F1-type ATP synthase epsilon subunit
MLDFTLTSPTRTTTYYQIRSVTLPAVSGQLQILPRHAEAFISLTSGKVILQDSRGQTISLPITPGQAHVRPSSVVVIL